MFLAYGKADESFERMNESHPFSNFEARLNELAEKYNDTTWMTAWYADLVGGMTYLMTTVEGLGTAVLVLENEEEHIAFKAMLDENGQIGFIGQDPDDADDSDDEGDDLDADLDED